MDGLSDMENVIESIFPQSNIQHCLVHVQGNISHKARVADRKQITSDFKQVYRSKDKKTAQKELDSFIGKWGKKYPSIKNSLISNQHLLTFYDYPETVRSTIYTTNLIEGNNNQLKRNFKKKEKFPNKQSQEKYLVCEFNKYNEKTYKSRSS